jgi:hypothetical protein
MAQLSKAKFMGLKLVLVLNSILVLLYPEGQKPVYGCFKPF